MAIAFRNSAGRLPEEQIESAERRLKLSLPEPYRQFLLEHNGGEPRPNRFRFYEVEEEDEAGEGAGRGQAIKAKVTRFFSLGGEATSAGEATDLEVARVELKEWTIPQRMLPIAAADDEFSGGVVCISVAGRDRGRIYYYSQADSTEGGVFPVADSLPAFLASLKQPKRKGPMWVEAIEAGDVERVRRWLDEGGALDETHRERTPLELAVDESQLQIVGLLLQRGDSAGDALRHALYADDVAIARFVLSLDDGKQAVSPDILQILSRGTPHLWRDAELIGQLIDLGADVNYRPPQGSPPLYLAAQFASPAVVRLLLQRGALANQWTNNELP